MTTKSADVTDKHGVVVTKHAEVIAAASLTLPNIDEGDAGKSLEVKGDETGYDLIARAFVPSGSILLWSGAINAVPNGWVLCDGANSSPDLRNKFVVGAGDTHAVDATGGASSVTPTITVDGHTLTESEMPAHTHSVPSTNHSFQVYGGGGPMASYAATKTTSSTGGGGSHSHGASSTEINTLPPYFALAYIMKT